MALRITRPFTGVQKIKIRYKDEEGKLIESKIGLMSNKGYSPKLSGRLKVDTANQKEGEKAKGIAKEDKEKGNFEDMEHLNKKRKLQNKVLTKMIENLDNQGKENTAKSIEN